MGKGRERERESDAIEEGCYIRDVGGVSAHNVEGGKKEKQAKGAGHAGGGRAVGRRGWFGCSARCRPSRSEARVTPPRESMTQYQRNEPLRCQAGLIFFTLSRNA